MNDYVNKTAKALGYPPLPPREPEAPVSADDPRRPGRQTEDLRKRLREYWECTADCRPPIGENKCLCALLNEAADALKPKIMTAETLRKAAEEAKARGAVGKKDRWA